jgi:hypothetical protein
MLGYIACKPVTGVFPLQAIRQGDPLKGSVDPIYSPRTACGKAEEGYIRAYNVEMARISPGSIKEYCK